MHTQQRVTLKSLKVAEFNSEETLCFTATVLFDGKPMAHARNDGSGGCTFLQPVQGTRELLQEAEDFAQSLPALVTDEPDPSDPSRKMTLDITLDFLVDCLAEKMHSDKQLKNRFNRDMRSKMLFCKAGELFSLRGIKPADIKDRTSFFAKMRQDHGADIIILEELPRDEAFAVWRKYGVQES